MLTSVRMIFRCFGVVTTVLQDSWGISRTYRIPEIDIGVNFDVFLEIGSKEKNPLEKSSY